MTKSGKILGDRVFYTIIIKGTRFFAHRLQGSPALPADEVALAALMDLGGRGHLCETNWALKLFPPLLLLLLPRSLGVLGVANNQLRGWYCREKNTLSLHW
jgi:hypothetical protein